ncbi:helix-turn-helix domain-containing protein [Kribbella solani]|uniref:DNA-binding transcriptional ArsR family regulator n=1 Tax=Kribbella solani TaxID=236067 RepID=A0A841E481_9ACTN|nr:helix-turn-helix domain-containing protein [Kribbella solani]MBB5983750.1 DNA-binding transcriptional ArsR family regulator [Kribbella solani]MDX2974185.1 helix-turn-helix domain-containing protein [Kribbella solani]MDX3002986.1 helix-turn-helix domain-containing protein [Kribbella solani]
MGPLELLGHPVRLRIVHALRGGRELTTGELGERITDVSKATLYRHVELLAEGGILEVAAEQRVRGAVERRFRLQAERASITPEQLAELTVEDHRRGFAVAMAALVAEFNAYADGEGADPVADLVGYRQHGIWLTEPELHQLIAALRAAILPVLTNEATPDRARYLLSPILFPTADN